MTNTLPSPLNFKDELIFTLAYQSMVRREISKKHGLSSYQLSYLLFVYHFCNKNLYFHVPAYFHSHSCSNTYAYRMNTKLIELGYIIKYIPAKFNNASHVYITDTKTKKTRKRPQRGTLYVMTNKGHAIINSLFKAYQETWKEYG